MRSTLQNLFQKRQTPGEAFSGISKQFEGTQVYSNEAVRKNPSDMGDVGHSVCHVVHFAYPQNNSQVDKSKSQDVVHWVSQNFTENLDAAGIVLRHSREVAHKDFDQLTDRLAKELEAIGWAYDGWGCDVASGAGNESAS